MNTAEHRKIDSIAFPAISTGIFGYPPEEAAEVAITAVLGNVPSLAHVKRIRFVLYSSSDLQVYERAMSRLLPPT